MKKETKKQLLIGAALVLELLLLLLYPDVHPALL